MVFKIIFSFNHSAILTRVETGFTPQDVFLLRVFYSSVNTACSGERSAMTVGFEKTEFK